jgi:isoquinoline 1-oxidoreductase alpha subunit
MPTISLLVNGAAREVDAPEDMPLLWVLRDLLQLTGTKYGCGVGACGACTVHLDGRAVDACRVSVASAQGKAITTIEGLTQTGDHPLQQAWLDHDVPQCGYCQAGQIMRAAALLAPGDPVDAAAVGHAMDGNLCRCGTYLRIRSAVLAAAAEVHP